MQQGWRFARGLRTFLRDTVGVEEARRYVSDGIAHRGERFLRMLNDAVWPFPSSPYRRLLGNAGLDAGSVVALVRGNGLDDTLRSLCDGGVYVAYEEFLGKTPARRGSSSFDFSPPDFHNPCIRADYISRSGGTRSGGIGAPLSFACLRTWALDGAISEVTWDISRLAKAVWYPALPAGAGINSVLTWAALGGSLDHWFSQIPAGDARVSLRKRLANVMLPLLTVGTGVRLPRPRLTTSPDAVITWCRDALARHGRACLVTYPTSAVALAHRALADGISLEGLVVATSGEPLTATRLQTIRASGARPLNSYGSTQLGGLGIACPACAPEEVHALAYKHVVLGRPRERADGVVVDAFCWTSLAPAAPLIAINLENDDYGEIAHDDARCTCELGRLGVRTRLRHIRGMSKVVAGGTTVPGEAFEQLVEKVLPARFGGASVHYQFLECEQDGWARLVVRLHPALGAIDEAEILGVVRDGLRASELGRLATDVWSRSGALVVERRPPVPTASGKILPFETLPGRGGGGSPGR
ncbi:MAG: hypothetical protein E6J14_02965 [Chloroflexi bacterium]|nr:MAG: hypothetical protein E6J14_02965 [Chloroflexota bacterium]